MKLTNVLSCIMLFALYPLYAQVGIGNTNPQASLDITASNVATPNNTDGILIPRMDIFPVVNPTIAQDGMLIFITGNSTPSKGFYYWDNPSTAWVSIKGIEKINDLTDGKSDNDGTQNGSSIFLGINAGANDDSSDNQNTAIGYQAYQSNSTGNSNSIFGYQAGQLNLSGSRNTYLGYQAGRGPIPQNSGDGNVFIGYRAGYINNTESNKLIIENSSGTPLIYGDFGNDFLRINGALQIGDPSGSGYRLPYSDSSPNFVVATNGMGQLNFLDPSNLALGNIKIDDLLDGKSDSDGTQDGSSIFLGVNAGANDDSSDNRNIGIGYSALNNNTIGGNNVVLGYRAMDSNTQGSQNISLGVFSLLSNTTGTSNVAIGHGALQNKTNAGSNIAIGQYVLGGATGGGNFNIGIGTQTLYNNTGSNNIGLGNNALVDNTTGSINIAMGPTALENNTTGNGNIAIGNSSLTWTQSSSNNIAIGSFSLNNATQGSNIGLGNNTGRNNNSGTSNIYLGHNAGYFHSGSQTLWIENSNADADNALIYGEFDNDILRTNSEFQIGNPTGTGYAFPTADGTSNQVLQTDGNGSISWNTLSIPSISGTTNYLPKFTGSSSLGNSQLFDSGTNVGIGTTTPSEKLSVNGIVNLNENITSGIALKVNGSEALWFDGNTYSWGFGGTSNLFIDKVGIGAGTASSAYKFEVRDTQGTNYIANINNTSTTINADGLRIDLGNATPGTGNRFIGFFGNGTLKGRISGNIALTGTAFYQTSDERLKENITDITNALSQISNIQPRKYNYIVNPNVIEYGFIAQELQPIYPQAVSGSPNSDVIKDPMMVSYALLTPLLTAGMQELHKKVEQLEMENEKLKKELEKFKALEARLSILETNSKHNID